MTLYRVANNNLYRYKRYTDIRLVFVPSFRRPSLAATLTTLLPRFNIDMALLEFTKRSAPES